MPADTNLDRTTNSLTWDCSYTFSYGGTMTRMLLFENGQFPFFIFGFRASKNFQDVVGFDPGRIAVAPTTNPYTGFPILMTNLAVEANAYSWASPPSGYGVLNYQWHQNGAALAEATNRYLNIASVVSTNAGAYTCVATDPSGTWSSATDSVTLFAPIPPPPPIQPRVQMFGQNCLQVTFDPLHKWSVDDDVYCLHCDGVFKAQDVGEDNERLPICAVCKHAYPIDFFKMPWWREDLVEQSVDHEGMINQWRVEPICAVAGKPGQLPARGSK